LWAQNPKFKAILAREKYRQGGHGKENDDDVDAGQGDVLATSAFLAHFMKKVERLEKAGEKTRWKKGESGSKENQWGKGESGSKDTQWGKGESGNKATQFKPGESGSKDTQWGKGESGSKATQFKPGESGSKATQFKPGESGSKATQFKPCGRFGVKGNAETYASMKKLAKAIGIGHAGLSKALTRVKQKTTSSALRVDFKCAGLKLFWDKESGVGESAVEEEEEEEEAT
jgi:hypothetical protein